jgi:hypothetical protein
MKNQRQCCSVASSAKPDVECVRVWTVRERPEVTLIAESESKAIASY